MSSAVVEEKFHGELSDSARDSEDDSLLSNGDLPVPRRPSSTCQGIWSRVQTLTLYLTNIITLSVLLAVVLRPTRQVTDPSLDGVYSPAASSVEYYVHRFESAFYNRTAYMGTPSPELNDRWMGLSEYGLSKINDDQAKRLYEPTMSNLDNRSEHLVTLDVFHQLHCLFSIRKYFWPEYYPYDKKLNADGTEDKTTLDWLHWDHCIDSIRQSLMCSGDITPVVYHIDPRGHGIFPKLQGTHVCRKWDKIVEWAKEHDGSDSRFEFKEGDAELDLYRLDPQGYLEKGGSE
ncbi:hypothetical protein VP1G_01687 [Cytospora mali]|uniref:Cyclochlorotine biosynthesis protein O n=1 Tax=Cytospora mali TaxID=578113 RepID=A0A194URI0_CYTMA|nr:hypothetical protein VP1G_01687 [Valsa mali var. pyri (nom. inval.)]